MQLNRDGKEVEEEFERSNDGRQASLIGDLINEGGLAYELFNLYVERVLRERIEMLECEPERLHVQHQRLLNHLGQE